MNFTGETNKYENYFCAFQKLFCVSALYRVVLFFWNDQKIPQREIWLKAKAGSQAELNPGSPLIDSNNVLVTQI